MTRKKLLALTGSVCLILALATMPFLTACPAPTEEMPTPPDEEKPAPPPTEEVITLRYADPFGLSEEGKRTWLVKELLEDVAQRSDGRVKFEYYWMGSLAGYPEMLETLQSGAADIGLISVNQYVSQCPMANVWGAVPFKPGSREEMAEAYTKLQRFPEVIAEWEAQNLMILGFNPDSKEICATKPLRSLDDIKGMKARLGEEASEKVWAAAGGVPVAMTFGEVWSALDKKIIDATGMSLEIMLRLEFHEVTSYYNHIVLSTFPTSYAMNLDSFNNLPPDVQEILQHNMFEVLPWRFAEMMAANEEKWKKELVELGVEFVDFPQAELEEWQSLPAVQKISGDWVERWEAEGKPARAIMELWLEAMW